MFYKVATQDFPSLKGRAAEMRHFPAALSHLLSLYMDHGDTMHQQMKLGLDMSVEMENILDRHKTAYKLPEPDATTFFKASLGTFLPFALSPKIPPIG